MKWPDFVASTDADPAVAAAADWAARNVDVVVWEEDDQAPQWELMLPALGWQDAPTGEREASHPAVTFAVWLFARATDAARAQISLPYHLLRPQAAGRCLRVAAEVLGAELAEQEVQTDAQVLLQRVWYDATPEQQARMTLDVADFEEGQHR